jgi:hypothetical protein
MSLLYAAKEDPGCYFSELCNGSFAMTTGGEEL